MVSTSVSSYIVGICFGIILVTAILLVVVRGWTAAPGMTSHRILYFVALSSCVYAQVKMVQLNSQVRDKCIFAEDLSIIFYHGSNTLQLVFYILRYREVFHGVWVLLIPSLITLVYASSIPIAAVLNHSEVEPEGACYVNHPTISAYLPLSTNFAGSAYMLVLFLFPFVKPLFKREGDRLREIATVSCSLFLTNSLAILFNIFFNISLTTSLGPNAPILSMIDLTVNFVMVCLPYFLSQLRKNSSGRDWSSTESQSNFAPTPMAQDSQSSAMGPSAATLPTSSAQPMGNIYLNGGMLPKESTERKRETGSESENDSLVH
ncbi:hypothetical protein K493DRAFT_316128 [Basidiobolus meristosporus CBS 931.73]|uniref:Uncharacterized protein n=1 Tax=Basidiobolus meristosporus CBS 931.73 TaxID=1314790 RepID=A0A1Y1Y5D7_9FUNG|nr:hypothetical protein K493DRAFT_316128 [Basidiobolus meristosporus CBS 931.73]|eukprot:ORX93188.1 hypothetical protein K493DRAFT_316128 [Basidiobolus meristosporus CBS 931.73]